MEKPHLEAVGSFSTWRWHEKEDVPRPNATDLHVFLRLVRPHGRVAPRIELTRGIE